MGTRYRLTITILLAALLGGGNTQAQVVVHGNVYGGGNLANVGASSTVNISSGQIGSGTIDNDHGNVFGGGNKADVAQNVTVSVTGGTISGDVYGGGALANTNTDNWNPNAETYLKANGLTINTSSVYGLYTKENDVYTIIDNEDAKAQDGVTYYRKGAWSSTNYNTGNGKTNYTTKVTLTGGTVRNVYGGALGDIDHYATVYGDVHVVLNGTISDINNTITAIDSLSKGCIVERVFGANNLFGTPMGHVTINIASTQNKDKEKISEKYNQHSEIEVGNTTTYDVLEVYGGGNLSAYEPFDALLDNTVTENLTRINNARTEVIIDNCLYTSIKRVYGGGNAASVPASSVLINGAYDIEEVFGGGNGNDPFVFDGKHYKNPGANVGYYNYTHWDTQTGDENDKIESIDNDNALTKEDRIANYRYGSGVARTDILGGNFYAVYGGSNSKGNISTTALSIYEEQDNTCGIEVSETYGGGKNAPMDGNILVNLDCVDIHLAKLFGGSYMADVESDIKLTITNGHYDQVFGGNNWGGLIKGSITVNIEETGCHPIIIGELYGGGNEAAYSVYGYNSNNTLKTEGDKAYADPVINVISCTKIGSVFGGGLGSGATMYGSPTININMIPGRYSTSIDRNNDDTPDGTANTLGTVGNVYGGGKQAPVFGSPIINIGTATTAVLNTTYTGSGYTENQTTHKYETPVQGAYITGNVYGGGLNAVVTGSSIINIGTVEYTTTGYEGVSIGGNVYGGGEGESTNVTVSTTINLGKDNSGTLVGNSTITGDIYGGSAFGTVGSASVNIYKGTVSNVFGGGEGYNHDPAINNDQDITAIVTNNASVTQYGGTVTTALYGGSKTNGIVQGNTNILVTGGVVGTSDTMDDGDGVFGGGYGQNTKVNGNVTVSIGKYDADAQSNNISGSADIKGDVYGGSAQGSVNNADENNTTTTKIKQTNVHLYAGTIEGNVYGGGLGTPDVPAVGEPGDQDYAAPIAGISALVYGDVTVKLNEHNGTAIVGGSIFGANNIKGTPQGAATVDIYGTYGTGTKPTKLSDYLTATDSDVENQTYELAGVFGGGNLAEYVPTSGIIARVNIYGCDDSSIKEVYGGGNAAAVPGCAVNVYGAYEIGYVYGGGKGTADVAANVTGNATTTINGGTIYRTFAGSNTNGDISGTSTLTIEDNNTVENCDLYLGDVFSYGNKATMSTPAVVNMGCLSNKVGALYGGAMNADINNNITLTINGGSYGKVFGGNKTGGSINGTITVNIEETDPSCAINIDDLFGCGNEAPYSVYGTEKNGSDQWVVKTSGDTRRNDPVINLYSFTNIGNVYGGGLGSSAEVWGNTEVNVNITKASGYTLGNVYGGGYGADVTGNTTINIGDRANVTPPTANTSTAVASAAISGDVFGGGYGHETTVSGTATINIGERSGSEGNYTYTAHGASFQSTSHIYGGSALGTVANTEVNLYAGTIAANVFGGGKGQLAQPADNSDPSNPIPAVEAQGATISTKATVSLYTATVTGNIYGGCNDNGTTAEAELNLIGGTVGTSGSDADKVFGGGQGHSTTTTTATVNIGSDTSTGTSTIYSNVYGGSALGAVGTAIVNMNSATALTGHVFGGGMGSGTTEETAATVTTLATVNQNSITLASGKDIYGGCNVNGTAAATAVNLLGGSVNDVFGGGLGQHTSVTGNVLVNVGAYDSSTDELSGTATVSGNVYGGSAKGSVNASTSDSTIVNLWTGTIYGDVFGGGLGDLTSLGEGHSNIAAVVNGNVRVNLNGYDSGTGTITPVSKGACVVKGSIYGCNNYNGSPGGTAQVHIYKTVGWTDDNGTPGDDTDDVSHVRTATANLSSATASDHTYELLAVYGGGNQAAFTGTTTNVVIETCDPSIEAVYGGGNAADATNTSVLVKGAYEIGTVFGGGNGQVTAANVSGTATSVLNGGLIHDFYGGSNTSGTIGTYDNDNHVAYGGTNITINDLSIAGTGSCELQLNNIYGAGKSAHVDGNVSMTMGCLSDAFTVQNLYGGAQEANIKGGITLTVTSGRFERVFGGNNVSGTIGGDIIVNLEETSCKPLIIGQVFGGGNRADHGHSTTVNAMSFTSIGEIYGGGNLANVDGSAYVNILTKLSTLNSDDESEFASVTETIDDKSVTLPAHAKGAVGAIGYVYGGGFGASTNVKQNVEVTIGSSSDATITPVITGDVYGGSALGTVNGTSAGDTYHTYVTLNSGSVTGSIYGGGLGDASAAIVNAPVTVTVKGGSAANVYGCNNVNGSPERAVAVNIAGGNVGNVYGGGNLAAYTGNSGTAVSVSSGTVGYVYGGGLGTTAVVNGNTSVTISGGTVNYDVYGGGSLADVTGNVRVSMIGGSVLNDVYGGGALANTNTDNWNGSALKDDVFEEVTGLTVGTSSVIGLYTRTGAGTEGDPYVYKMTDDLNAKNKTYYRNTLAKTTVNLTGGIIGHHADATDNDYRGGNVYGGGLGRLDSDTEAAVAAMVYGDVTVTVDGTAFIQRMMSPGTDMNAVPFSGRVFGCNNLNGTPKANVMVTVLRSVQTVEVNGITTTTDGHTEEKYDIHSVYGGGNLSKYDPATGKESKVIIDGCDDTSIEKVFGGGNSAGVPSSNVLILGSYKIGYVFGGGNGADKIWKNGSWEENNGAPVTGTATVVAIGGRIGKVFGGSDTNGNVGSATVSLKGKGSFSGDDGEATGVFEGEGYSSDCPLRITNSYGAGRGADIDGDINFIVSGCTGSDEIENVFGGSFDANIKGSVTLTITSGFFTQVFGGNDHGGFIAGDIKVNIEETEGCNPIVIQHLYGGGNAAAYPGANAKNKNNESVTSGNIEVNVKSATRIDNVYGGCYIAQVTGNTKVNINMVKGSWATDEGGGKELILPIGYTGNPVPNIHSGYIEQNIADGSSVTGYYTKSGDDYTVATGTAVSGTKYYKASSTIINNDIGTIGNVYGGGYDGNITGSSTVNIGTETTVPILKRDANGTIVDDSSTPQPVYDAGGKLIEGRTPAYVNTTVLGAHITGSVHGGGNLADVGVSYTDIAGTITVTDSSFVNICAKETGGVWQKVTVGTSGVSIAGDVFGGGKGIATAFTCHQGMVGGTHVRIGDGTVHGSVYGGGEVGRVEKNTAVTIGYENGSEGATKAPVIDGNVFGAGAGVNTHGYSALVRGKSEVTIQGNTWVKGSVYGGGEVASVGKYKVGTDGMPYALSDETSPTSGYCYVKIKGYAEIGPDNMVMNNTTTGKPDDAGHVFGAGKGVLPYEGYESTETPWRVTSDNTKQYYNDEGTYLKYIETLALATQTDVTIGDHAFVKGSVYGGSENGIVQHNTKVTIQDNCQIGNGHILLKDDNGNILVNQGLNRPYSATEWENGSLSLGNNDLTDLTQPNRTLVSNAYNASLPECASWQYGQNVGSQIIYEPYDKFANASGFYDNSNTESADGGRPTGSDGHTFFGNVFGGGSGYYPYAPGKWHEAAGAVYGNTQVVITGGHILTNIYGGNELTNVGKGVTDTNGGKCTITMNSGTLGVPRTLKQILAHPVTCYLFGAGKGDQRTLFNKQTNVNDVDITITGGRIYGSVFGGGEDGHVMRDVTMTIGNNNGTVPTIGTWGTSYVDGNVFGGGRGFGGEAYTAGNVGGNVNLTINNGTILGSVYGGGRLGSVGYGLYSADEEYDVHGHELYGAMRPDNELDNGDNAGSVFTNGRGHIEIEINGGTIGNNYEYIDPTLTGTDLTDAMANMHNTIFDTSNNHLIHTKGGNVFAGGMGRREMLDGETEITVIDWRKLGNVKSTKLTINGGTIKSNVYGGGEFGAVKGYHTTTDGKQLGTEIIIQGGTIGTTIGSGENQYYFGSVYGGGMGQNLYPSGNVDVNTSVEISGGTVRKNVYGGGEVGSVGTITNFENRDEKDASNENRYKYRHDFSQKVGDGALYSFGLSWPYEFIYDNTTGLASVTIQGTAKVLGDVYGASKGEVDVSESDITQQRFKEAIIANVRETNVTINLTYSPTADPDLTEKCIGGSVYGGGEDGHVYDSTTVIINNGLIGGSVFGGGKGEGTYSTTLWDHTISTSGTPKASPEPIYSWTAGKVYGNATVIMNGGWVMQNVYGGGYFGSVGKGNYAGGQDDYYPNGYGELPLDDNANLWTTTDGFNPKAAITSENKPISFADHFMSSGVATVTIKGGTIGTADGAESDGSPYGNVFGSSRGKAAIAISGTLSPRYRYIPNFYLGYANETNVTIGDGSGDGPRIYGSVYGGGQDGHVRRDAKVTINNGVIGLEYNSTNQTTLGTDNIKSTKWMARGNVYGAGSGLGKYSDDTTAYNYSSGSVTCVAEVEINGGTIYQNVYGGGALASIGPPNTSVFIKPQSPDDDESDQSSDNRKSKSYTKVSINGGSIGNESGYIAGYGGNVFAASRGNEALGLDSTQFATDLWSKLDITGGTIYGNVYGGGEFGRVKQGVTVNILGGEIKHDVYGGGALASTNTSAYAATPAGRSTVLNVKGGTMNNIYGGGLGRLKFTNHIPKSDIYPTSGNVLINLNQDVYGDAKGAIVNQVFGANNYNGSPQGDITIHVYATQNKDASKANISSKFVKENTDVTVLTIDANASDAEVAEFISKLKGYLLDDIKLANALSIDTTGYQTVYYNSSDTAEIKAKITALTAAINSKIETAADPDAEKAKADAVRYDVQAIYGGGNLAAYEPDNNSKETTKSTVVIIDGCDYTSIRQVYGSGNAASSPATHVIVNASYEIDEVFGGGNGADAFELVDGNVTIKYINPGANIGYKNYTHFEKVSNNYFDAIVNDNAKTKEGRNEHYTYGSGIATTDIRGGTIHTVYGGSNKKGNIRTTALSVYEDTDDTCPVQVDETYGGGKDAPMDGNIDLSLDCVKDMPRIFGGAKNADVNANIVLNITNGDFEQVFGGNNTSGNVYGSITVNVEEKGCQPITIGELYAGGYLAPYSIYGYYQENEEWKPRTREQWNALTNTEKASAGVLTAFANPRVNIISAQRIDTIFGGGYHADMVASPYINVNMQKGKFYILKKNDNEYEDVNHDSVYTEPDTIELKDNNTYRYYKYIPIGTIGTIYGGGLEAVIDGNTHIDIGTGEWRNIEWKREMDGTATINNENVTKTFTFVDSLSQWSYVSGDDTLYLDEGVAPTPVRKAATITGNVFGGGSNADVTGNTNINIANGHIYFNVYGGGRMGSVGTILSSSKHDDVETGFALSWPYELTYKDNTGVTNINITGGRIGFAGKDNFDISGDYPVWHSTEKLDPKPSNIKRYDNGDIYGGGKGEAGDRYEKAFIANVKETHVTIDFTETPDNTDDATSYSATSPLKLNCIAGSVYGGGEDGHVYGNTYVSVNGGMIGHAVYGGGKGKSEYETTLLKWKNETTGEPLTVEERQQLGYYNTTTDDQNNTVYTTLKTVDEIDAQYKESVDIYSITAGKVYGNTNVTMTGGHVIRNIFGGGNLGSVGKGNYAGGTDDYTFYAPNWVNPDPAIHVGYGEVVQGSLWTTDAFKTSGIATITVTGGTVGTADGEKDDLPTGNVFGGCRGIAVPIVPNDLQPRYLYCPEFFLGYVNEAIVTIGTSGSQTGPRIYGSVYGGGQDGHVRRETNVTVYSGEIGNEYSTTNRQLIGTLASDPTPVQIDDHTDMDNIQWLHRGNVLGAGSGIGKYDIDGDDEGDRHSTAAGSVTHRTIVNIKGGKIHHNVYGGGSLASVGPPKMGQSQDIAVPSASNGYTTVDSKLTNGNSSISIVNIEGKVGDETSYSNGYGGNVFGSSRGANATETLALETGKTYASDFYSQVNIKAGANVLGDVFGGGEAGLVFNNASVIVSGLIIDNDASKVSKIGHDVFGGGDKADVMGNTDVTITGGHILHNVYGGGRMGSVGTVTDKILHNKGMASDYSLYEFGLSWPVEFQYAENTGKATVSISGNTRLGTNGDDNGDVFGGGMGDITVNWTELIRSDDRWSTMGSTDDERIINYLKSYRSFDEAEIANLKETDVTINLPFTGTLDSHITPLEVKDNDGENKYKLIIDASYDPSTDTYTITRGIPCITGSVYGGSENGHVNGDTRLELVDGIVGHALYGGGKGKGTYQGRLYDINNPAPMTVKDYSTLNTMISEKNASLATDKQHDLYGTEYGVLGEQIYSITAGKVYGNTYVTMDNGYVLRNIFGGGNLGSVGKGNYAGGADDYSTDGYGERPDTDNGIHANLWTSSYDPEAALSESNKPDFAWHFINSGQTNIDIKGGQIGYILPGLSSLNIDDSSDAQSTASKLAKKDDLPTGNVFGGSRGQASPSGRVSPRYMYIPDYFLGYVNQTNVIIGTTSDTAGSGPKILGSVYGGGQDGHVRRDAHVTVNNASIGVAFSESANTTILGTNKENLQWRGRGNVFGAGSGIGTYTAWEKDKNGNYNYVDDGLNFASGSVTNNTIVTINKNAVIYQNVYGGGSLASIGPPDMGLGYEQKIPETTFAGSKSSSSNNVIINGGTIGHADSYKLGYGGNVFGASRGNISNLNLGATPFLFATSIWTNVEAKSGHIFGNVFGGGENGAVNKDTYVEIGGVPVGQTPSSPAPGRSNTQQTEPAQQSQAQPQDNAQSRNSANGATQGNAATESQQTRTINTNRAQ